MFEEGREKPPLSRNMPPTAGSIKWCRGLLVRLRCTWVRLQALSTQLEATEPGRRAAAAMTGARRLWAEGSRDIMEGPRGRVWMPHSMVAGTDLLN